MNNKRFANSLRELPLRLRRITTAASYRPEIDGLRFFAISFVLIGHLMQRVERAQAHFAPLSKTEALVFGLARPEIGVFLFFAISGFIIASQFLKRPQNPLQPAFLKSYFTRRLTRIEPPYIILLLATFSFLSLTGYVPSDVNGFAKKPDSLSASLLASLFYSHGWLFGALPRLFPPGWSLEIEVQFYILAPLLFFLYFRIGNAARRLAYGAAIALLACILVPIVDVLTDRDSGRGQLHLYYTIVEHFHQFWIGIVLADASKNLNGWIQRCPPRLASAAGWFGTLLLASTALIPARPAIDFMLLNAVILTSVSLMFLGALQGRGFKQFCSHPWISLLGGACYSIYLIHLQSAQVLTQALYRVLHVNSAFLGLGINLLVQLPLLFAIGLVFYWAIERPFMQPDWPARVARLFVRRREQAMPADEA